MVTPEKSLRRGLSHRSDVNAVAPTPQALRLSLGPLSPEKLEEILSEANRLAAQLEQCSLQEPQGAGSVPRKVKPSPRRETFVLKDSPVRDLLPTVSSSSSLRSSPHSSNLTPRLGSSDRKGSTRALRTSGKSTSGKKPLSTKRVSLGACIGPRGSVSACFVVRGGGADYPRHSMDLPAPLNVAPEHNGYGQKPKCHSVGLGVVQITNPHAQLHILYCWRPSNEPWGQDGPRKRNLLAT